LKVENVLNFDVSLKEFFFEDFGVFQRGGVAGVVASGVEDVCLKLVFK